MLRLEEFVWIMIHLNDLRPVHFLIDIGALIEAAAFAIRTPTFRCAKLAVSAGVLVVIAKMTPVNLAISG